MELEFFASTLQRRKTRADMIIANHWRRRLVEIHQQYGETSWQAMQAFDAILSRGGKRIRAALAETSYRMFGGRDQNVIDGMSLALEMIHAYLLITDDISDRSDLRRGGPSAHRVVEEWHKRIGLRGDRRHFGANVATLAAMAGMHDAMTELTKLPVEPERAVAGIRNLNDLLAATCQGQINDIRNEMAATKDYDDVERALVWKTAYYSFVNPLQLGAILAGAGEEELGILARFGLHAGRAFQISDDILSLFEPEADTGKNPMDDIREGKRTLLVLRTLEATTAADAIFLESCLGNDALTAGDFERCKAIVQDSGALAAVQTELETACDQARRCIAGLPEDDEQRFLIGLTNFLRSRRS